MKTILVKFVKQDDITWIPASEKECRYSGYLDDADNARSARH